MQQFLLNAELREDVGKGASRRLRHSGKLPGIIYGTKKEPMLISLQHNELMHQLEQEAFYSHILEVIIGKNTEKVVLKDLQRHPYMPSIQHIDFLRIDEKEKLTMRVPLHFINESKCPGVKEHGGKTNHILNEIEISCLPKDLPEYIEVDVGELELDETIHIGDLKLPENVDVYTLLHGGDPAAPVVSVHIPRIVEEEVEEVEEVDEIAEGEVTAPSEPTEATEDDQASGEE